jgi:hypothetical protein
MYDASGQLKIKGLNSGIGSGMQVGLPGPNISNNSTDSYFETIIRLEKNPFQQRRGTSGDDTTDGGDIPSVHDRNGPDVGKSGAAGSLNRVKIKSLNSVC